MRLLIIRHGQSEADILNVHEGRADFSLTDLGRKEAEAMAEYVDKFYRPDRIYASPMKRTRQTAQALSDKSGVQIQFDDRLMEWNNGLIAGFTFEEADKRYPEQQLSDDEALYEMESNLEFRTRAESVLNDIVAENSPESTIVIVTHGGMINQLYRSMLGMPVSGKQFFGTSDTGIHIWNVTSKRTIVIRANLIDHLSEDLRKEIYGENKTKVAYFAGGCFWCMTPVFKMYGADKVLCGYSGGDEVNPTYDAVKHQQTGHRETMAVEYDSAKVSYEQLLDIYLANVDAFDGGGQFIDRGHSYTLAVYYTSDEEKALAERKLDELRKQSGREVFVAVEKMINFYEAEEYHQDYYLKNPEAFEKELVESGRKYGDS